MGFFRRTRRSRQVGRHQWAGRQATGDGQTAVLRPGYYRSAACPPLRPWQVRGWRFGAARFGRRGLDPDEVQEFLDRLADELGAVYDALGNSVEEAARCRNALRRWQGEQARRVHSGGLGHGNSAGGRY
ncbi:DivIVA domain-containing protein [Micromonospora craniellae]|uniref:DivIVA domain-containing protein n=1 Tax=Micromonospora craniellae TaxID=2294034 RepID=UPI00268DCD58